jgi:hypothetical protein
VLGQVVIDPGLGEGAVVIGGDERGQELDRLHLRLGFQRLGELERGGVDVRVDAGVGVERDPALPVLEFDFAPVDRVLVGVPDPGDGHDQDAVLGRDGFEQLAQLRGRVGDAGRAQLIVGDTVGVKVGGEGRVALEHSLGEHHHRGVVDPVDRGRRVDIQRGADGGDELVLDRLAVLVQLGTAEPTW